MSQPLANASNPGAKRSAVRGPAGRGGPSQTAQAVSSQPQPPANGGGAQAPIRPIPSKRNIQRARKFQAAQAIQQPTVNLVITAPAPAPTVPTGTPSPINPVPAVGVSNPLAPHDYTDLPVFTLRSKLFWHTPELSLYDYLNRVAIVTGLTLMIIMLWALSGTSYLSDVTSAYNTADYATRYNPLMPVQAGPYMYHAYRYTGHKATELIEITTTFMCQTVGYGCRTDNVVYYLYFLIWFLTSAAIICWPATALRRTSTQVEYLGAMELYEWLNDWNVDVDVAFRIYRIFFVPKNSGLEIVNRVNTIAKILENHVKRPYHVATMICDELRRTSERSEDVARY